MVPDYIDESLDELERISSDSAGLLADDYGDSDDGDTDSLPTKEYEAELKRWFDIAKEYKITYEEELALIERLPDPEAREKLILGHVGYALNHALRFSRPRHVFLTDVIEALMPVLARGIDEYDKSRGAKLRTFLYKRVRNAIRTYLDTEHVVRIPPNKAREFYAIEQAFNELTRRLEASPSPEELAEESGYPLNAVQRWLAVGIRSEISYDPYGDCDDEKSEDAGIDNMIAHNGANEVVEFRFFNKSHTAVPQAPVWEAEAQYEKKETSEKLSAALARLSKKERMFCAMKFEDDMSSRAMATKLGMTIRKLNSFSENTLSKLKREMEK